MAASAVDSTRLQNNNLACEVHLAEDRPMSELTIDNQIINAIRQISQAVETYSHFLWQEYGLTAPQLGTLRELEARGKGTPTEIAQWMSVSAPTAAGIFFPLKGSRKSMLSLSSQST